MFFLWYSHHQVLWYGYAPSIMRRRYEGAFRALSVSGWFAAWFGLFPFAFSLVSEFAIRPYSMEDDSFRKHDAEVDKHAGITACLFALAVLLAASFPIALLTLLAPNRKGFPYGVILRICVFPLAVVLNVVLLVVINEQVFLWPLLFLVPLSWLSSVIGTCLDRRYPSSALIVPLLSSSEDLLPAAMDDSDRESILPSRRNTRPSFDAQYFVDL